MRGPCALKSNNKILLEQPREAERLGIVLGIVFIFWR